MQQYADIYLLRNYPTCFGRPSRPSSGVHKTVVAASGTDRTVKYKKLNLKRNINLQGVRQVGSTYGGGGVRRNTTVLYRTYYADDMFRPLWVIFRSQKCI